MTLLELERVLPEHLNAVLELDHLCFGGLWTLDGYQRELDSPNSDLVGLFSPISPAPRQFAQRREPPHATGSPAPLLAMGCLWAILEEAHITILAVNPHYQRQGLGQAMLIALLIAARNRGLERATLEVRASNQPALSLYQKFSFKLAGRRRRYYQDTGEDALILWRGGLNCPEFAQILVDCERQISDRLSAVGWDLHLPRLLVDKRLNL